MSLTSKQLRGVETRSSSGATTHTIEYFVLDADLASYVPSIGDAAAWAPNKSYVSSYNKSWYGPGCWLLSITAEEEDSELVYKSENLSDEVAKSYSVAELFFPRQWWGVRKAGTQEAGYSGTERSSADALLDIFGHPADNGSLLFPGATKSSKGSPDYSLCPFSNPGSSTMPVSLIEQKVKIKVYSLSFYTKRAINTISDFVGVNGSFGGACAPTPSESGKWRADEQSLRTVKDSKGKQWVKVYRRMSMAPGSLRWNADKNGGTWIW
jgi:hypothetical protein